MILSHAPGSYFSNEPVQMFLSCKYILVQITYLCSFSYIWCGYRMLRHGYHLDYLLISIYRGGQLYFSREP